MLLQGNRGLLSNYSTSTQKQYWIPVLLIGRLVENQNNTEDANEKLHGY
jgi:hypothetical protein